MRDATFDVLIDIDGVLYPFPEVFTPYAADQLGRELELDTTRWEFYEEWGARLRRLRRARHAGRRRAPAVVGGRAVRRRAGRASPGCSAGGHRLHLVTARDITGAEAAMAATNHWLAVHDLVVESVNLAQDKPTRARRARPRPGGAASPSTTARTTSLAWEDAGVFAVVLDRWGTYRGDHRSGAATSAASPTSSERHRRRQLVGVARASRRPTWRRAWRGRWPG